MIKNHVRYLFVVEWLPIDPQIVAICFSKKAAKEYVERLEEDILATDGIIIYRWNTKTQDKTVIWTRG